MAKSAYNDIMLIDMDKVLEENPDFEGVVYENTKGCNAKELVDYLYSGKVLSLIYTDPEVGKRKIVNSKQVWFDKDDIIVVDFTDDTNLILDLGKEE